MVGTYKQIDHTADIAFKISGASLEELFHAGSKAWLKSVTDENKFDNGEIKNLKLISFSKEQLLVDFLSELNFYLFTKKWLCYSVNKLLIKRKENDLYLTANLVGNKVGSGINLKLEIKAITFHQMDIKKTGNIFSTLIVFDI